MRLSDRDAGAAGLAAAAWGRVMAPRGRALAPKRPGPGGASAEGAMRGIMGGGMRSEPPVIEHQREVTVDLDPFGLADDQDPIEPAGRLLAAISRWVVPERAGVGRTETIIEARARSDWR